MAESSPVLRTEDSFLGEGERTSLQDAFRDKRGQVGHHLFSRTAFWELGVMGACPCQDVPLGVSFGHGLGRTKENSLENDSGIGPFCSSNLNSRMVSEPPEVRIFGEGLPKIDP